jgi:nucleotide-binding universal stress UspA family protein
MFRKILVGLEGSEASWCAFRRALALCRDHGSELWTISVEEHIPRYAATIDEVQDEQEYENTYFAGVQAKAREIADEYGVTLHCRTVAGHAAQCILERANSGGFDLIVLGHRGHSNPMHRLAGSTADRVVDHASCCVLIGHPAPHATDQA